MSNYKKIKILLTLAIMTMALVSVNNKSISAQTLPPLIPIDPLLQVYVMTMSDGYEEFFCLDQHPFDLFGPDLLSDVTQVYPWAVPASELVPSGIIDLNRDGQVNGVECELYGGMYDNDGNRIGADTAPPNPLSLTQQYGPVENGVITLPPPSAGSTFILTDPNSPITVGQGAPYPIP